MSMNCVRVMKQNNVLTDIPLWSPFKGGLDLLVNEKSISEKRCFRFKPKLIKIM